MTTRKRVVFAAVAMLLAFGMAIAVLLAADLYVHHRTQRYAGVNIWGYRGPTVPKKRAGEHRLVVIGGSTAFGYGVDWDKAFPAQLERALQPVSRDGAPVRVVNLGFSSQGAYAFRFALEDYLSLQYDAAILYEGYNDVGDAPNEFVGRRDSPVFRLTGYYPMLHTALREKAMALRTGGDLDAAYGGKTVFKPGLAARGTAAALEAALHINEGLNRQFERLSRTRPAALSFDDIHVSAVGCDWPWEHYCGSVYDAIVFALAHGKKVLVVTQPYGDTVHREQQQQLRWMLQGWFAGDRRVGYADLGDAIDLKQPALAYDGMHLTVDGNAIIASRLVAPVAALMPEAFGARNPPVLTTAP